MTDLWTEASLDHEALAREAAFERVSVELGEIMPFLLASRSDQEYAHRRALAEGRLEAIALRHGLDPAEVLATADRRFSIFTEALAEGVDPVDNLVSSTRGGSGPGERLEHHEGPDFSGGYSEVPRGDLEHVADDVVRPVTTGNEPAEWFQPVSRDQAAVPPPPAPSLDHEIEHTGKRKKAKRKTARKKIRKKAQGGDYMATTPPDLGTGSGSQDIGVSGVSGVPGPPSVPAGMLPAGAVAVPGTTPVQQRQVTSSRDPVRAQVLAVTASVRAANPWLPEHEASRIAREAVGRYFAVTDWSPTQWDDSPPRQSDGGGGGGSAGGTGPAGHVLEWQGLKSMMPGGGGGAGGAAGELGEAAELAAL